MQRQVTYFNLWRTITQIILWGLLHEKIMNYWWKTQWSPSSRRERIASLQHTMPRAWDLTWWIPSLSWNSYWNGEYRENAANYSSYQSLTNPAELRRSISNTRVTCFPANLYPVPTLRASVKFLSRSSAVRITEPPSCKHHISAFGNGSVLCSIQIRVSSKCAGSQ
jgi:hypothetical protein